MDVIKQLQSSGFFIDPIPSDAAETMAYVPFQKNDSEIFTPAQGFALGTMFPELNKPFYGSKCGGSND